jgi:hydrogenase-4 component B
MRSAMSLLALLCLAIGLAPIVFWPAIARASAAWNPAWPNLASPAPLLTLGHFHIALTLTALIVGTWLWRRVQSQGFKRAFTWDCGYANPSPRMQYTAGSFAGVITGWFRFILRPLRHEEAPEGYFPLGASHSEHTPETVLERVVAPVGRAVLHVSTLIRRLQHGRVQSYVFYILVGLLALAAWVSIEGTP